MCVCVSVRLPPFLRLMNLRVFSQNFGSGSVELLKNNVCPQVSPVCARVCEGEEGVREQLKTFEEVEEHGRFFASEGGVFITKGQSLQATFRLLPFQYSPSPFLWM